MPRYHVDIWVGSGQRRWNAQSISVTAGSIAEARWEVAERLCLTPAYGQGDDPPLELVVLSVDGESEGPGVRPLRRQPSRDRWSEPGDVVTEVREPVGA